MAETRRSSNMALLRQSLWPEVPESDLWSSSRSPGWVAVPRTFPIILQIMDSMSVGKPVSSTYLDLWSRNYNDNIIILSKPREMAAFAGFSGPRAEQTWLERLRVLDRLGFIQLQAGPAGSATYALLINPYLAIKRIVDGRRRWIKPNYINGLKQRAAEIGAASSVEGLMESRSSSASRTSLGERPRRARRPTPRPPARTKSKGRKMDLDLLEADPKPMRAHAPFKALPAPDPK